MARGDVTGERMRSSRYFKIQAQKYVAAARAGDIHAKRYLGMVRAMCAMFLEARRQGISLDEKIRIEGELRVRPSEARREAREAGDGKYRGSPCSRCGNTIRFTCDNRCATCKPGCFEQ